MRYWKWLGNGKENGFSDDAKYAIYGKYTIYGKNEVYRENEKLKVPKIKN